MTPDHGPGRSGVTPAWWPRRTSAGVSVALTAFSVALWIWGVARIDISTMSDAGLISVLGWQFPAAFGALGLAFARSVNRLGPRYLLAIQTVLLVLMMHGITALAEPHPAYFTAYLHVGFVDEVISNGRTVPSLDARFNWPGSFAFGALVTAGGGASTSMSLVRWAPVLFNVAYLAPLWLIGRALVADTRARWLALWLFVAANWVHQDYLSPQAEAYFLYLVVVAIVLRYFSGGDPGWGAPRSPLVPAFASSVIVRVQEIGYTDVHTSDTDQRNEATQRFLLRALVIIVATAVVSHQLTPFAIIVVTGALVLTGVSRAIHLPMIVVVLFAGWFSVGATTWWDSHLGDLLGDFGQVGDNASAGLLARLGGSDLRAAVLWLRVGFSLTVFGGALIVALLRTRRGSPPVAALALLLPPFALIGGQSYGGEVLLRSYLFALPAAVLLVAQGLARASRALSRRSSVVLLASTMSLVALAGLTVRFGNEHFEQVSSAELAAVDWVYENVPHDSVVIAPTRNLPWRYRDLTSFRYEPVDEQPLESAEAVLDLVPDDGPAYLIATDAQQLFGEQLAFLPAGWLDAIVVELEASGRATIVFRQGDATVYRLEPGDPR